MKKINTLILVILSIIIISCSPTKQAVTTKKSLKFSILGGINLGGITDNTDMSVLQISKNEVDAISGATRTGFNVGIHINRELLQNQIEFGIDYMYNHQIFTYNDADNSFIGVRKLGVSQFLFLLTKKVFYQIIP
ncbi:MAG: hypothetical protein L3J41_17335 [Melioribacteraceae bacterium]|nr:hypothetical protein [Melioribacteraceae bacterium]